MAELQNKTREKFRIISYRLKYTEINSFHSARNTLGYSRKAIK